MKITAKLKKALIKLGLKKDATDVEARQFMQDRNIEAVSIDPEAVEEAPADTQGEEGTVQAQQRQPQNQPDTNVSENIQAMRNDSANELVRIEQINALESEADPKKAAEIKANAIRQGWSVDKCELELVRAGRPAAPNINTHQTAITPQVIEASVRYATAPETISANSFSDEILTAASRNPISSISGLIRACCAQEGIHVGYNANHNELVQAGFSSSSLTNVLGNTLRRSLAASFTSYPGVEDVRRLTRPVNVKDFRKHNFVRLNTDGKMEKVGDTGNLKYGYLKDSGKGISVDTEGKIIGITRPMMVNDDLGALVEIPRLMANDMALAFISSFWAIFINNEDEFYSADNGNLNVSETGVNNDGYKNMTKLFRKMKDENNNPILVNPKYVVVSADNEDDAIRMAQSRNLMVVERRSNSTVKSLEGDVNPYTKYIPLVSPWLGDTQDFYGVADPAVVPAFAAGYLHGRRDPFIEDVSSNMPPEFLGGGWIIYFDFGFAKEDHQGVVKMEYGTPAE